MFRLTRSTRLSRRSRSVSAVIGIAAVLWMVWIFVFQNQIGPPPAPDVASPTERLSFAKLAADEEIVVTMTRDRRTPTELRFRREGAETNAIVSEVRWSESDRAWKMTRVLQVRPLLASEAAGLDAVVAEMRQRRSPTTTDHFATYSLEHRRAEVEIGREKLFETLLVDERNQAERFGPGATERREASEKNVRFHGVAPEAFWKWVTFEMLLPHGDEEEND